MYCHQSGNPIMLTNFDLEASRMQMFIEKLWFLLYICYDFEKSSEFFE